MDASVFLELFGSDANIVDHSNLAVSDNEGLELMKAEGTSLIHRHYYHTK